MSEAQELYSDAIELRRKYPREKANLQLSKKLLESAAQKGLVEAKFELALIKAGAEKIEAESVAKREWDDLYADSSAWDDLLRLSDEGHRGAMLILAMWKHIYAVKARAAEEGQKASNRVVIVGVSVAILVVLFLSCHPT